MLNINPFGVETGIFWENYVNTMAANALALHVISSHSIDFVG